MLRGGEHGHIPSNFRNDADGGKRLDIRHLHNKVELRKILLSGRQNQRFGRNNTGNNKELVDIHPAADRANNFEHNASPRNGI